MILHCYFTDGLFDYAKLLINSFKFHNGDGIKIVLTTRDLAVPQVDELYGLYKNLDIINGELDYHNIAKLTGLSIEELAVAKEEVEMHSTRERKFDLVKWKQYISIEDRYRNSIIEVMNKYKKEDFLIHIDADMYIRKPLQDLFDLVSKNDFTITFRLSMKREWQRVFGCLLGVKLNERGFNFIDKWRDKIDSIPLIDKPYGYGQTSCYLTYMDLKKNSDYRWGNIPEGYVGKRFEQTAAVWSGNYKVLGKVKNRKRSEADFSTVTSGKQVKNIIKIK